ncbi:MAG: hypothetical protein J6W56_08380 [Prevotella sp.]|nr:hypothetical protein [Prevotella sp.]
MTTLHVFNPEHDLALAANLSNFTSPLAGRQLRREHGYLPALWAAADDAVLVEDVEAAKQAFGQLTGRLFSGFVTKEQLASLPITGVDVWGWDLAIRAFLLRQGVEARLLPTEDQIATIRELSHRRYASAILAQLQGDGIIGEAMMTDSLEGVRTQLNRWERIVVKSPWSGSGRGVRFLEGALKASDEGWIRRIISQQGSMMVEPQYHKVEDFGMEFESDGAGQVTYLGLSVFETSNGAYTGNILDTEDKKESVINRYIPKDLLYRVREKIIALTGDLFRGKYLGPFGVDMMVVASAEPETFLLHPCVEINLRRTMGHVALSLTRHLSVLPQLMAVRYDHSSYKIKLTSIE